MIDKDHSMTPYKVNPVELQYHISFWEDRLGLDDQRLLIAFVADHMVRTNKQMSAMFEENLDDFGHRLAIEDVKQRANIRHILSLKKQIGKLSKGFRLGDHDLEGYFTKGQFLHDELRRAIHAKSEPPQNYPNGIVPLSLIFTNAVKPELPEEFWKRTPFHHEFHMAVTHMNDEVLGHLDPEMTPLLCYFHHHRMAELTADMASVFKGQKRHNWENLAQILSRQNEAAALDIIDRVQSQIWEHDKPQFVSLKL
jgi:hypothetical protein